MRPRLEMAVALLLTVLRHNVESKWRQTTAHHRADGHEKQERYATLRSERERMSLLVNRSLLIPAIRSATQTKGPPYSQLADRHTVRSGFDSTVTQVRMPRNFM